MKNTMEIILSFLLCWHNYQDIMRPLQFSTMSSLTDLNFILCHSSFYHPTALISMIFAALIFGAWKLYKPWSFIWKTKLLTTEWILTPRNAMTSIPFSRSDGLKQTVKNIHCKSVQVLNYIIYNSIYFSWTKIISQIKVKKTILWKLYVTASLM